MTRPKGRLTSAMWDVSDTAIVSVTTIDSRHVTDDGADCVSQVGSTKWSR
jgi:hypothetical protein